MSLPDLNLEDWIIRQRRHAAAMMRQSISPAIVKIRPRFFQTIIPRPGAVVASPVLAAYDPEPDYFFHWYRDSAVVMEALFLVQDEIPDAAHLFADFVRFSSDLAALDGRDLPPPAASPGSVLASQARGAEVDLGLCRSGRAPWAGSSRT